MPTIRELREVHYISRKELADLAGVSESTLVRIEDPSHKTRYDIATKVVDALSKRIGEKLTLTTIEGLNLYNVMRDRKPRTKNGLSSEAA